MTSRLLLLFALALTLPVAAGTARAQLASPPPVNQPLPKGITNPGEFGNYVAAINIKDPQKRAETLELFQIWYPQSVLRIVAFEQLMAAWHAAGNPDKADAAAVKLLELDPNNVRALANRAYVGRMRAMAGNAAALAPAVDAARRGMAALPKWPRPGGLGEPEFTRLKMQMVAVFDGALGYADLQAKDYAKARSHFSEAVSVDPENFLDVYQLSVAMLEGQPLDATGFWYAGRAIALARAAKNETTAQSIEKYARSRYEHYHGSEEGWDGLLKRATAQPGVAPDKFAGTVTRALTPPEAAVQMASGMDIGNLSFVDWEFILAHRDDSPDNKAAAEKVWKVIVDKQKGGARLKIPVKIVAATPEKLEAAISEENQASNTADLVIEMAHRLNPLPATGSTISIIGTIQDYQASPFRFFLSKAELADESLPVAGGACAEPRPQVCTRDYRPACGVLRDGSRKTYGNACSACADPAVLTQSAGTCP
ncbi:MAG TPA: hypothetical protein VMI56_01050 [Reyranella sp.]|nr:hypothetical protein [Reyranella sp.]